MGTHFEWQLLGLFLGVGALLGLILVALFVVNFWGSFGGSFNKHTLLGEHMSSKHKCLLNILHPTRKQLCSLVRGGGGGDLLGDRVQ